MLQLMDKLAVRNEDKVGSGGRIKILQLIIRKEKTEN